MSTDDDAYTSARFSGDSAAVIRVYGLTYPIHFGWSYGYKLQHQLRRGSTSSDLLTCVAGTVASDLCQHITSNPLAGIVYLAALPYIGTVMQRAGTELRLSSSS